MVVHALDNNNIDGEGASVADSRHYGDEDVLLDIERTRGKLHAEDGNIREDFGKGAAERQRNQLCNQVANTHGGITKVTICAEIERYEGKDKLASILSPTQVERSTYKN